MTTMIVLFDILFCRVLHCHVGASSSNGSHLCDLWCCQAGLLHPSVSEQFGDSLPFRKTNYVIAV